VNRDQDAPDAAPFDAYLFDMDGVLVDSERPALALLQALLADEGLRFGVEELRHVCGRPAPYMRAYLSGLLGDEVQVASFEQRYAAAKLAQLEAGEIRAFAGVHDLLAGLRASGGRLAVATSTERGLAQRRLERFALLPCFDRVVSGDEVEHGKPAPDIFLRAAAGLAAVPERCLVVEDSLVGISAGKRAGMTVYALATTFPAAALGEADRVFADVPALTRALLAPPQQRVEGA